MRLTRGNKSYIDSLAPTPIWTRPAVMPSSFLVPLSAFVARMGLLGVENRIDLCYTFFKFARERARSLLHQIRRKIACPMMSLNPARRDELIERIVQRVDTWRLRAPAILFLQMHAPLGFLASQFLFATQPFVSFFGDDQFTRDLALLLEEPTGIERLLARLETELGASSTKSI